MCNWRRHFGTQLTPDALEGTLRRTARESQKSSPLSLCLCHRVLGNRHIRDISTAILGWMRHPEGRFIWDDARQHFKRLCATGALAFKTVCTQRPKEHWPERPNRKPRTSFMHEVRERKMLPRQSMPSAARLACTFAIRMSSALPWWLSCPESGRLTHLSKLALDGTS